MNSPSQYIALIESMLAHPRPQHLHAESASRVQVERGAVLLSGDEKRLDRLKDLSLEQIRVTVIVDAAGHARPVYRPLLIYCWLQFAKVTRSSGPWDWCNDLTNRDYTGNLPAQLWSALTLLLAGELFDQPDWVTRGRNAFNDVIAHQQINGTFIPPDASSNPETRWYDELILLHAMASFATHTGDGAADQSAAKSANYHLTETQPDHATAQPWGLLAFIRHAPPLADQVLHALAMQYPDGVTGVPLLLLADVLYGLQRFTTDNRS